MCIKKSFCGPDFIIIGAMRAGTTSLASHLSNHPDIGISRLKETDYYIVEKNYSRGLHWYKSMFPDDKKVIGEASPNYTKNDVFHGVPERIYKSLPDVKLIYMVRDPVKRFLSQYKFSLSIGHKFEPPDEMLSEHEVQHILASSMYYKQIQSYLDYFPREQILVIDFEDYISDTYNVVRDICRYIGASDELFEINEIQKYNSSVELSQTPLWLLKASQQRWLINIRATLPSTWRNNIRHVLSKTYKRNRQQALVTNYPIERVRDALVEDAEKFRILMEKDYSNWSV